MSVPIHGPEPMVMPPKAAGIETKPAISAGKNARAPMRVLCLLLLPSCCQKLDDTETAQPLQFAGKPLRREAEIPANDVSLGRDSHLAPPNHRIPILCSLGGDSRTSRHAQSKFVRATLP